MYVSEKSEIVNGKKVITDSHIMTNDEVKDMNNNLLTTSLLQSGINEDSTTGKVVTDSYIENNLMTSSTTQAGASKYQLDISIVRFDMGNYKYTIQGHAEWNGLPASTKKGPSLGEDTIALTWGGDGELKSTSRGIAGTYAISGDDIDFYKSASDYQKGYAWNFEELIPLGVRNDYADWVTCEVDLKKTYSKVKNLETGVRLTYIHTYEQFSPSVSFSGSLIPSVSVSGTTKQWPLEIDLPGFDY